MSRILTYPERKISSGELMNPVQYSIATGIQATALTSRVEFTSRRERCKQFVSLRIKTLSILIPLWCPWIFPFLRSARHTGNTGRHRGSSCILENRSQSQHLTSSYSSLRVVSPKIAIFCKTKKYFLRYLFTNKHVYR